MPDFPPDDDLSYDYLGRFDLDNEGVFSVDVYQNEDADFFGTLDFGFEDFFSAIDFDPYSQDSLADLLTLNLYDGAGEARLDTSSPDVRGGYDKDEVIAFMNHTGFWGIAFIYYDNDIDAYYVDVEDVSP